MALSFSSFQTWLWRSSTPDPNPNPSPPANTVSKAKPSPNFPVPSSEVSAASDGDAFQLSRSSKEKNSCPQKICGSTRKRASKGRHRRRQQSLDLDFDMVIVQPNYISGSESEGSDWSVGWLEPHAPEFCSDGEPENSFAVLVPCYAGSINSNANCAATSKSQLWAAVLSNIAKDSHKETNYYLQQWVTSLQT